MAIVPVKFRLLKYKVSSNLGFLGFWVFGIKARCITTKLFGSPIFFTKGQGCVKEGLLGNLRCKEVPV